MEILILAGLILLNGAFAMAEMALVTARKARLKTLSAAGDRGAAAAMALNEDPTKFLSTIQIGITSIGVLNGIVGEATFAVPLAEWLRSVGLPERASGYASTGLIVIVITYVTIVLGELVPKRIGQVNPEAIASFLARPMQWLAVGTKPFVKLLTGSTEFFLRLLRIKGTSASQVTEEEIRAMIVEGADAGVIEEQEHKMLRNVFRLDDRQLGSLMVTRRDVVCLDVELTWEENLKRIAGVEHNRFPVVRGSIRDVLGVISARQLLSQTAGGKAPDLMSDLQPAVFAPETLTGMEILQNIRRSGAQLVFVIDEYGEVLGIVTLSDVLEAITGEFKPHSSDTAWALQRDDGSWLLDGGIPTQELQDTLSLPELPEGDRYHTLAGMLLVLFGRLPHTGDRTQWMEWDFEVVDMDGKRIDKVIACQAPAQPHAQETPSDAPQTPG